MKRTRFAAVLCAGLLLLSGCGKTEAPKAELQTGYFDVSGLTDSETYSENLAGNYTMADEKADPPAAVFTRYTSPDGEKFLFDQAGRLRSYAAASPASAENTGELRKEEELRAFCDSVLSSYLPDYAEFTEITSRYYETESNTYDLAMEHKIADGIADYALIRLDTAGEVLDISISYADADGDCAEKNFVTDEDKAYFEKQAAPYLEALADYSAKVNYTQYKHAGGRLYAFYEFTYTDPTTGLETGSKLLIFVR